MKKLPLIILIFIISFYICFLFSESQGYYKSKNEKAKALTDEQIEQFEKDVKEGKKIDINDYVLYRNTDYSTDISNDIYKISLVIENFFDKAIKLVFNNVSKTVND